MTHFRTTPFLFMAFMLYSNLDILFSRQNLRLLCTARRFCFFIFYFCVCILLSASLVPVCMLPAHRVICRVTLRIFLEHMFRKSHRIYKTRQLTLADTSPCCPCLLELRIYIKPRLLHLARILLRKLARRRSRTCWLCTNPQVVTCLDTFYIFFSFFLFFLIVFHRVNS